MTRDCKLNIQLIISDLNDYGFIVLENFLTENVIKNLNALAKDHYAKQKMQAAKIGLESLQLNNNVRGDSTFWLDEHSQNQDIQAYFKQMNLLKHAINEHLFLNVHEIEAHLAIYPVGSFYQKHLDQFNRGLGRQARQISSVLYLNANWHAENGGELRLYLNEYKCNPDKFSPSKYIDILPNQGRMVLFLSHQFWHEVLPAKGERLSLAGWFRSRI